MSRWAISSSRCAGGGGGAGGKGSDGALGRFGLTATCGSLGRGGASGCAGRFASFGALIAPAAFFTAPLGFATAGTVTSAHAARVPRVQSHQPDSCPPPRGQRSV